MHSNPQQIWLDWAAGELTDAEAQAAAELAHAPKPARRGSAGPRPQHAPAAVSGRLRADHVRRRRGGLRQVKREKVFGSGRHVPLDRNAKSRIMMLARALKRPTEKGRHYGRVTAKCLDVLAALLWRFHNAASGKCFPSYEAIADAAGCNRDTVYEAIRMLEAVGLLTWVNRITRVREWMPGLFGKASAWRTRVVRTSNSYVLTDPLASKSEFPAGTSAQDLNQTKDLWISRAAAPELAVDAASRPPGGTESPGAAPAT
jgi:helix-turn-helix protein